MKILAVDPLAPWGHVNFNTRVLGALREIGHVSFITFHDYHQHFTVDERIDIPDKRGLEHSDRRLRFGQAGVLRSILRTVHPADYDAVVFLCYEAVSLALRWPKDAQAFVFEHNNTDKARENPVKMFLYKRIPRSVSHLVFMDYIGEYIARTCGRQSFTVPLNYTLSPEEALTRPSRATARDEGRKTIFVPSTCTRSRVVRRLKDFVLKSDRWRMVSKGRHEEESERCRVRMFFDDYQELMDGCDLVFFGGEYGCRASAALHEAMSCGKPIVGLDCPFIRAFEKRFPNAVCCIREMDEIDTVRFDLALVRQDQERFVRENSPEAIREALRRALCAGTQT
ncbi:hypothetical protein JW916_01945 [Candidatus Sumerlaeota bacterium]|nr:hypothetical protein [Candidatus Sumerlaeota bacterium]